MSKSKGGNSIQPRDDNPRGAMPDDASRVVEVDDLTPEERVAFEQAKAEFEAEKAMLRQPANDEEKSMVAAGHGCIVCRSCDRIVESCRCHGSILIRGHVDDCSFCRTVSPG